MRMKLLFLLIILGGCVVGCTPGGGAKKGEDEIKQAFAALQTSIKAKDADKIWDLLDKDSQADADREAKAVKEGFGKTADKDKPAFEEKLELNGKELADMTGKLYLKSKRFYAKYHEIPGSKLDKINITGDAAKINYIEADFDDVKMSAVREKGQWKFIMPMPTFMEK